MATDRLSDSEAVMEYQRGEYLISTSRNRLNLGVVHGFLTNCYWAKGIPREVVARSIEHALCFGVYDSGGEQIGFARVISDFAHHSVYRRCVRAGKTSRPRTGQVADAVHY